MQPFQFAPLEHPESEVRLLHVLPGTGTLHCRLVVTALDASQGSYEPLSYCWGDATRQADIVLNDCSFSIGADLHAALRRLRYRDAARILWVDAVCINQGDNAEKSAQVPLMTRIYREGQRTLIWLGEHDARTAAAFDLIEFMASQARARPDEEAKGIIDWIQLRWREGQKHSPVRMVQLPLLAGFHYHMYLLTLESILKRPWFRRVWIIQEVAVSPKALVICGACQIGWETIEVAFGASDEEWYPGGHLENLVEHRERFQKASSCTLTDVLLIASESEATNPRDRIYAVLGLLCSTAQQSHHGIKIDYGADTETVFREATVQCLQSTGSSSILAGSVKCRGAEFPGLPSWVLCPGRAVPAQDCLYCPAWTLPGETRVWWTTKDSVCQPILRAGGDQLGVAGYKLDRIRAVGCVKTEYPGPRLSVSGMANWIQFLQKSVTCYFDWRALAGLPSEKLYRDSDEPVIEAFRKTLVIHGIDPSRDANVEVYQDQFLHFDRFMTTAFPFLADEPGKESNTRLKLACLKQALRFLFSNDDDMISYASLASDVSWCQNKRFIVTETGYMGLSSRDTREGDWVVLLAGAQTPFVLRPAGSEWTLVGECYLHGAMQGEAWDESLCDTIWIK